MPFKYKLLVVFFSLGIMMIGFGTFSLISPDFDFNFFAANDEEDIASSATFGAIRIVEGKSKNDILSELDELIERYFHAKQEVDMDTIAQCVSNVKHVDEKKLLTESAYVEGYENIQCKVMNGISTGAYRVYVYYDVKVYDIDTLIPSLNALYVKQNEKGKFEVYLGKLDSMEQKYIDRLDESEKVQALVKSVQNQLEDVVSADREVRDFYEMLEGVKED